MANPTTYFGWVMPTSSSLVTNLPADFNTFGQGVDTSLQDLLGGTTGQVLSKTSGTNMDFTWVTPTDQTPLTTKGDLFAFSTVDARLPAGANETRLVADSAQTLGLKYVADTTNYAIAAKADLLVGTAADTLAALTVGTNGQVLTADSTVSPTGLKWATPASGGGMTLLSTTTLSGASTTISSINQTYQHLYVIVYGVTNATADGQTIIRANSEASIYYGTNIRNTTIGTTAGGGITFEQGSRTSVVNINAVTFWDYADTFSSERHLVSGIGYTPSNTNFQTWGGLATASAVSSLYFYNSGGNFSGGTVEIWGIK
jgi:hypothetical protein